MFLTSLRSDHARFWNINNKNYQKSLPAVVLHDTGMNYTNFVPKN